MTYDEMSPTRLDLTGTFGLRVADQDAAEVRIGTVGRWEQQVNLFTRQSDSWAQATPAPQKALVPGGMEWTFPQATVTAYPQIPILYASSYTSASTPGDLTPGVTYTMVAYIDSEGLPPLRIQARPGRIDSSGLRPHYGAYVAGTGLSYATFTTAADEVKNFAVVSASASGASIPAGARLRVHVDLYEGAYRPDRMPFTGDTPDTPAALHHWTGIPHASTSVRTLAWQPEKE